MMQQEDLIPKQEEAATAPNALKSKTLRRTSYASFFLSIALEVCYYISNTPCLVDK
jgi:hypothetical protein